MSSGPSRRTWRSLVADVPRVSAITTVYNGEAFLGAAIESILQQTLADFEYILVDDASTDRSSAILRDYAAKDARLKIVTNPHNLNPSGALNRALACARAAYVANLDQDDLAWPERLERQVGFLDAHPEVGVLGAQVQMVDASGRNLGPLIYPTTPELARWQVFFRSPVLHSAAMMRRSLVEQAGGYSVMRWFANDYILFARLLAVTQITNLADTLVSYRRHGSQTASRWDRLQRGQVWLLIHALLNERLGLRVGLDDIAQLYRAVRGEQMPDAAALARAAKLLSAIHARYAAVEGLDATARAAVDQDCAWRWLAMAWTHRHTQRAASRAILQRARQLDPRIWRRRETWNRLHRLRRAQSGAATVRSSVDPE